MLLKDFAKVEEFREWYLSSSIEHSLIANYIKHVLNGPWLGTVDRLPNTINLPQYIPYFDEILIDSTFTPKFGDVLSLSTPLEGLSWYFIYLHDEWQLTQQNSNTARKFPVKVSWQSILDLVDTQDIEMQCFRPINDTNLIEGNRIQDVLEGNTIDYPSSNAVWKKLLKSLFYDDDTNILTITLNDGTEFHTYLEVIDDFVYSDQNNTLTITTTSGEFYQLTLPVVTNSIDGLAPKGLPATILDIQNRLQNLEASGVFRGTFNTLIDVPTSTTAQWDYGVPLTNDFVHVQTYTDGNGDTGGARFIAQVSGTAITWVFAGWYDKDIPIATTTTLGVVKYDGATITMNSDNQLVASGGGGGTTIVTYVVDGTTTNYQTIESAQAAFTTSTNTFALISLTGNYGNTPMKPVWNFTNATGYFIKSGNVVMCKIYDRYVEGRRVGLNPWIINTQQIVDVPATTITISLSDFVTLTQSNMGVFDYDVGYILTGTLTVNTTIIMSYVKHRWARYYFDFTARLTENIPSGGVVFIDNNTYSEYETSGTDNITYGTSNKTGVIWTFLGGTHKVLGNYSLSQTIITGGNLYGWFQPINAIVYFQPYFIHADGSWATPDTNRPYLTVGGQNSTIYFNFMAFVGCYQLFSINDLNSSLGTILYYSTNKVHSGADIEYCGNFVTVYAERNGSLTQWLSYTKVPLQRRITPIHTVDGGTYRGYYVTNDQDTRVEVNMLANTNFAGGVHIAPFWRPTP
jgi:hypothetical protein